MSKDEKQTMFKLSTDRNFSTILIILAIVLIALCAQGQTKNDSDIRSLLPNQPIERTLKGNEAHLYNIALTAGQFLHVVVDQRGIDVVVILFGPDGKNLLEVDSPNGTQGAESLSFIVETTGNYRLNVSSLEKTATVGNYEVKIQELRKTIEQDKNLIVAEQKSKQAGLLQAEGKVESLRSAIKKYEEALLLYQNAKVRNGEATILSNIGNIYYLLGDRQKALNFFIQSFQVFQTIGDQRGEATALTNIGVMHYALGDNQKALDYLSQALSAHRTVVNRRDEAATLINIGRVYDSLGSKQKALDYYAQALPLIRAVNDRYGEAVALNNIGLIYYSLGDRSKAISYYEQALSLHRSVANRRGETLTLISIGSVYDVLGDKQKALNYYVQALPITRATGDRYGETVVLINIGGVYRLFGDNSKALNYYNQALLISREIRDPRAEIATLNKIGLVYDSLSEKQKALDYFNQALPITRAVGDRRGEAETLTYIGAFYSSLGDKSKALTYYTQALSGFRIVRDLSAEAETLIAIGSLYYSLGEKQKALDYFNQALPITRAVGNRSGEAGILNNVGGIYNELDNKQKALDYYAQALVLVQATGIRNGEARTLSNIGVVYNSLGENQKALDYFYRSLPLIRAVGDHSGEAKILKNLMTIYRSLDNPRLAIFYGKQSVNIFQQLRSNIQLLDKEIQKTYLKTIEQAYRDLADLLIVQERSTEAQQVLNAFKDQQFFDFDQSQQKQPHPLTFTSREEDFALRYEKINSDIGETIFKMDEFRSKLSNSQPDKEETNQLQQLDAQFKTASNRFSDVLKQAEIVFLKPNDERNKIGDISDTVEMQAALRELSQQTKQKTAAVYTLVGKEKFSALIITDNSIISVSKLIKDTELNEKALQLWGLLQSDSYDPTLLSKELYKIIFEPIEDKLPKDTKTIIWSLDGNLRYIPMAALYDGRQYLVERYNHVLFTRADGERMTRAVSAKWTGYGFASSKPHKVEILGNSVEFKPLDYVKDEMQIFRTSTYPKGIIDGEVFPETEFNKVSLIAALKQKRPLVHISSHFSFRPGDESRSFLLLGDGNIMTLAEMKEQKNLFQGVELLTLSACDTAAQQADARGREIDAFAELAQRLGAGGVMASLWAVLDSSTAQLMKGFYKYRQGGKYTKAEALKKAQLDLLYGRKETKPVSKDKGDGISRKSSSDAIDIVIEEKYRIPFKKDVKRPFAHPYYWAPFVLFGNWR